MIKDIGFGMEEGCIGDVCAVESGLDVRLFEVGEVEGFGFELGLEVTAEVAKAIEAIAFGRFSP
jgi:hypothetical protein